MLSLGFLSRKERMVSLTEAEAWTLNTTPQRLSELAMAFTRAFRIWCLMPSAAFFNLMRWTMAEMGFTANPDMTAMMMKTIIISMAENPLSHFPGRTRPRCAMAPCVFTILKPVLDSRLLYHADGESWHSSLKLENCRLGPLPVFRLFVFPAQSVDGGIRRQHYLQAIALGHAIGFLLHRAGVGIDVNDHSNPSILFTDQLPGRSRPALPPPLPPAGWLPNRPRSGRSNRYARRDPGASAPPARSLRPLPRLCPPRYGARPGPPGPGGTCHVRTGIPPAPSAAALRSRAGPRRGHGPGSRPGLRRPRGLRPGLP